MQPQPIHPDSQLSVIMTAGEWNLVLELITNAAAPYRVTAPVISKMQDQLVTQAQDVSNKDVS